MQLPILLGFFAIHHLFPRNRVTKIKHVSSDTGRCFVDGLFIVTRRVWPITCDVILRKISNDEEINIWVLSMFHDTNSTLCKVISNHHNAGFRLKVINIFRSVNLTLSRKGQQIARNAETRWNMTEDSRVKRSLF